MEEIFPLVYDELRRMAARKLRDERTSHTLSATALVHEAWLELTKLNRIKWQNRSHYLAVAAQAMRRILIDYAVARRRQKRGGGQTPIHLDGDVWAVAEARGEDLLALDEALARLSCAERAPGANRRMPLLRRDERGGNRRNAEHLAGHRQAGVGDGARLAESGAAGVSGPAEARSIRWRPIAGNTFRSVLADAIDCPVPQRSALCSTPAAPATRLSGGKWSRC